MPYRVLADAIEENARATAEENYLAAKLVCSQSDNPDEARQYLAMLGIDLDEVSRIRSALKDSPPD